MTPAQLATEIERRANDAPRFLVALAGPPGSGKSTVAADIAARLKTSSAVVPMDGFHLDNADLIPRGLLDRKGAPETFDAAGFIATIRALRTAKDIHIPTFDRSADCTVPDGALVCGKTRVLLIEGNYLLLKDDPWSELAPLFDLTIALDVPRHVLEARLIARWQHYGLTPAEAEARARGNDMRNVDTILTRSRAPDITLVNND